MSEVAAGHSEQIDIAVVAQPDTVLSIVTADRMAGPEPLERRGDRRRFTRRVIAAGLGCLSLVEAYSQIKGDGMVVPALGIFAESAGHFGIGFDIGLPIAAYAKERLNRLQTAAAVFIGTQVANAAIEPAKGELLDPHRAMAFMHDSNTPYDALAAAVGAGLLIALSQDRAAVSVH